MLRIFKIQNVIFFDTEMANEKLTIKIKVPMGISMIICHTFCKAAITAQSRHHDIRGL